jgi:hypothetical protein
VCKIGAKVGNPGTVTIEDIESAERIKKSLLIDRLQRHTDTAIAIAEDVPYWIDVFLAEVKQMLGDLAIIQP